MRREDNSNLVKIRTTLGEILVFVGIWIRITVKSKVVLAEVERIAVESAKIMVMPVVRESYFEKAAISFRRLLSAVSSNANKSYLNSRINAQGCLLI